MRTYIDTTKAIEILKPIRKIVVDELAKSGYKLYTEKDIYFVPCSTEDEGDTVNTNAYANACIVITNNIEKLKDLINKALSDVKAPVKYCNCSSTDSFVFYQVDYNKLEDWNKKNA